MPNRLYDYEGSEFDWFLMDGKKRVALCSSAGFGDVPVSVLDGLTNENLPINEIPSLVEQMAKLGGHDTEGSGPGECIEWRQMADRGFFVFDWRHWKGPYERVLAPEVHRVIGSTTTMLPANLRAVYVASLDLEHARSFQVADFGIDFVPVNARYQNR